MTNQNQNHTTRGITSTANGNGKTPNNTTVRLNGSAVNTTLQPAATTPKSTLSVSVNVEKLNQSECTVVTQELWQYPPSAERLIWEEE